MGDAPETQEAVTAVHVCPECLRQFDTDVKVCPDDNSPLRLLRLNAKEDPLIGQTLDERWLIERKLGEGGMGKVYLAHQLNIERKVAIKVMHRGLERGREYIERFLREAKVASQVAHPHLVSIFDFGQTKSGDLYIAMEFLDGLSLADQVRRERLTLHETLDAICQLCDGLAAAHDVGIIHRDLKPDNIFVLRMSSGDVFIKLLDFGIAKHLNAGRAMTQTGQVFGTPEYMSPEQCQGTSEIDGRSDLYSVGCILYELLTGYTPFRGDTMLKILFAHVSDPPPKMERVVDEPSLKPLERITYRLLAKRPSERFANALALSEAIAEARDGLAREDILLPAWRSITPDADGAEPKKTARFGEAARPAAAAEIPATSAPDTGPKSLQNLSKTIDPTGETKRPTPTPEPSPETPDPTSESHRTPGESTVESPERSPQADAPGLSRRGVGLLVLVALLGVGAAVAAPFLGLFEDDAPAPAPTPPKDPAPPPAPVFVTTPDLAGAAESSPDMAKSIATAADLAEVEQDPPVQPPGKEPAPKKPAVKKEPQEKKTRRAATRDDEPEDALSGLRSKSSLLANSRAASKRSRKCFVSATTKRPDLYDPLKGTKITIKLQVTVPPDGTPENVVLLNRGEVPDDPDLIRCVSRQYEQTKFTPDPLGVRKDTFVTKVIYTPR